MLIRKVMMPDGVVRNEHHITCVTSRLGSDTMIDVESRAEGVANYITQIVAPFTTLITEEQAFDALKNSPSFPKWTDPVQDALDELLPILTDEQAEMVTNMYPEWAVDISYTVGERVQYDSKLYRCVQAHTSQAGWEPPITPALWTRTAQEGEIPEWIQPTGAQDAYNKGDKVTHNGSTWESDVDANVWEPGIYGWTVVNE